VRLWLLRHARVVLPSGLCYGASDVAADAALTEEAAALLAEVVPRDAACRVSGLARAQQLMTGLQKQRPDLDPPQIDPRLNEMDFGAWEMRRWDAIPRSAFDGWMADFAHHRVGGGESTQQVIDRVALALCDTRLSGASDAVWVCHAGVIRAAQFVLRHGHRTIAQVNEWPEHAPEPGGFLQLTL
jgi:alpha-ribazole phosphatase